MKLYGEKAGEFGRYEAARLWGTAWPLLLGVGAQLLTQLATDVGSGYSAAAGAVIALLAKAIQQRAVDNTGRTI